VNAASENAARRQPGYNPAGFWQRQTALRAGAVPFLPGELLKMALVIAAVRGVELAQRRG
jgi:hypothetical protein